MIDQSPSNIQLHREALLSQAKAINEMLKRTSDQDLLGVASLQNRLNTVETELSELAKLPSTVANIALLFSGDPVVGSRSIDASFAGMAIAQFQDVIEKRLAFLKAGPLGSRGPVSKRPHSRLNITGLAFGSFGFVFEEKGADEPEMFDSAIRESLSQTIGDMKVVISGDAKQFDNFVGRVDTRVFISLRNWFNLLNESGTQINLIEQENTIQANRAEIAVASKNLSETEVEESTFSGSGVLWGILPLHRRFEFKLEQSGEVISGSVGPQLSSDYLERLEKGDWIGKPMVGDFAKKTVKHVEGREYITYRLLDLDDKPEK